MQPLSFLRQIANFSPGRDMIFQNFGQGVSNLSTVAELRTFDGNAIFCVVNLQVFLRRTDILIVYYKLYISFG